jgi:small GTP-binding protein
MKVSRSTERRIMPQRRKVSNPPIFKIAIVGSQRVGKTTFTKVYQSSVFEIKYIPTMDYITTDILFESPSTQCIFNIYDISGKKNIPGINDTNYSGTNAIILMFDTTNKSSYDNLEFWYNDIMRICSKDIPIVLIENKCDITNYRIDKNSIASQYESKGIKYFEVSARRNENVKEVFEYIYEKITGESSKQSEYTPQLKAGLSIQH